MMVWLELTVMKRELSWQTTKLAPFFLKSASSRLKSIQNL